jgi:hypothetical protein
MARSSHVPAGNIAVSQLGFDGGWRLSCRQDLSFHDRAHVGFQRRRCARELKEPEADLTLDRFWSMRPRTRTKMP